VSDRKEKILFAVVVVVAGFVGSALGGLLFGFPGAAIGAVSLTFGSFSFLRLMFIWIKED